jgi:hypothetical protein
MSTSFSVAEILARLEARIAHHEEQVAFRRDRLALLWGMRMPALQ